MEQSEEKLEDTKISECYSLHIDHHSGYPALFLGKFDTIYQYWKYANNIDLQDFPTAVSLLIIRSSYDIDREIGVGRWFVRMNERKDSRKSKDDPQKSFKEMIQNLIIGCISLPHVNNPVTGLIVTSSEVRIWVNEKNDQMDQIITHIIHTATEGFFVPTFFMPGRKRLQKVSYEALTIEEPKKKEKEETKTEQVEEEEEGEGEGEAIGGEEKKKIQIPTFDELRKSLTDEDEPTKREILLTEYVNKLYRLIVDEKNEEVVKMLESEDYDHLNEKMFDVFLNSQSFTNISALMNLFRLQRTETAMFFLIDYIRRENHRSQLLINRKMNQVRKEVGSKMEKTNLENEQLKYQVQNLYVESEQKNQQIQYYISVIQNYEERFALMESKHQEEKNELLERENKMKDELASSQKETHELEKKLQEIEAERNKELELKRTSEKKDHSSPTKRKKKKKKESPPQILPKKLQQQQQQQQHGSPKFPQFARNVSRQKEFVEDSSGRIHFTSSSSTSSTTKEGMSDRAIEKDEEFITQRKKKVELDSSRARRGRSRRNVGFDYSKREFYSRPEPKKKPKVRSPFVKRPSPKKKKNAKSMNVNSLLDTSSSSEMEMITDDRRKKGQKEEKVRRRNINEITLSSEDEIRTLLNMSDQEFLREEDRKIELDRTRAELEEQQRKKMERSKRGVRPPQFRQIHQYDDEEDVKIPEKRKNKKRSNLLRHKTKKFSEIGATITGFHPKEIEVFKPPLLFPSVAISEFSAPRMRLGHRRRLPYPKAVLVCGLPNCGRQELEDRFMNCGVISRIKFIDEQAAWINFEESKHACRAIEKLNGTFFKKKRIYCGFSGLFEKEMVTGLIVRNCSVSLTELKLRILIEEILSTDRRKAAPRHQRGGRRSRGRDRGRGRGRRGRNDESGIILNVERMEKKDGWMRVKFATWFDCDYVREELDGIKYGKYRLDVYSEMPERIKDDIILGDEDSDDSEDDQMDHDIAILKHNVLQLFGFRIDLISNLDIKSLFRKWGTICGIERLQNSILITYLQSISVPQALFEIQKKKGRKIEFETKNIQLNIRARRLSVIVKGQKYEESEIDEGVSLNSREQDEFTLFKPRNRRFNTKNRKY